MGLKDRIVNAAKLAEEAAAARRKAEIAAAEKARGPEFPGDDIVCAMLGRETPSQPWDYSKHFIALTTKQSVAWRSTHATVKQMREVCGQPKYECIVVTYDDMMSGNFKRQLKPPKGFDFRELKVAPMKAEVTAHIEEGLVAAINRASGPVKKGPVQHTISGNFQATLTPEATAGLKAMLGKPVKKSQFVTKTITIKPGAPVRKGQTV